MEGVRRAEAGDLRRCGELLGAALAANQARRGAAMLLAGEPDAGRPDSLIERWTAEPDTEILVGTFNDVVVGVGAGRVVALGARTIGRIDFFYVEPDARSVGVGQAIVDGLVEWFVTQGCTDVDAVALPGDRSSKQLLESSGFKARLLVLHRSLG